MLRKIIEITHKVNIHFHISSYIFLLRNLFKIWYKKSSCLILIQIFIWRWWMYFWYFFCPLLLITADTAFVVTCRADAIGVDFSTFVNVFKILLFLMDPFSRFYFNTNQNISLQRRFPGRVLNHLKLILQCIFIC